MLKRILAIVFLLFRGTMTLTSCASDGPTQVPSTIQPLALPTATEQPSAVTIPFTTIAQEAPLGDHPVEPFYTVIADPGEWDELRGRLPDRTIEAGIRAGESSDTLIVVAFAGVKGASGHSITVESIVQEDDHLVVTISQTAPSPDDIVEPATTLPYHLATFSTKALPSAPFLMFTFRDVQGAVLGQGSLKE